MFSTFQWHRLCIRIRNNTGSWLLPCHVAESFRVTACLAPPHGNPASTNINICLISSAASQSTSVSYSLAPFVSGQPASSTHQSKHHNGSPHNNTSTPHQPHPQHPPQIKPHPQMPLLQPCPSSKNRRIRQHPLLFQSRL